jgi:hypothetical protein
MAERTQDGMTHLYAADEGRASESSQYHSVENLADHFFVLLE